MKNDNAKNIKETLQLIDTEALIAAAKGNVDIMQIIKNEIASRGMNDKNAWIGFDNAKKFWNSK